MSGDGLAVGEKVYRAREVKADGQWEVSAHLRSLVIKTL